MRTLGNQMGQYENTWEQMGQYENTGNRWDNMRTLGTDGTI